jgi:hypothetical protein
MLNLIIIYLTILLILFPLIHAVFLIGINEVIKRCGFSIYDSMIS